MWGGGIEQSLIFRSSVYNNTQEPGIGGSLALKGDGLATDLLLLPAWMNNCILMPRVAVPVYLSVPSLPVLMLPSCCSFTSC